jgi:hypothetical protein
VHGVEPICRARTEAGATIAPSTYHAAKTRPPSARSVADAAQDERILATHAANYGVYGLRTNGLLRQYFPKGTGLTRRDTNGIQAIAVTLNSRLRKTLGWKTPAEVFAAPHGRTWCGCRIG